MAKNVTIYTSNTCAYCRALKDFLNKNSVTYNEINIDDEPQKRQELVEMSGQMAVPITIITGDDGSKEMAVGFDAPKISAALGV